MDNDFSEIFNKFSNILKEKNIDLNNIAGGNGEPPAENADLGLDIDTILKIKEIISKMNKNQNCPRNHLLHALKPYLQDNKKEKLEQYIKIANILSIMENLDLGINFFETNQKGYDLILIITLLLLII